MIVAILYLLLISIAFITFEKTNYIKSEARQIDFMDRNFTGILRGIAITFVILSHVGNANNIRIFAPLGGMGVAIFLICSGYGLNESYLNELRDSGNSGGGYWQKRIKTVCIPYWITRVIAWCISGYFNIKEFLLDVLFINPAYVLGWYLRYLLIWYFFFWIIRVSCLSGKRKIPFLMACSAICFILAPNATEGQQIFSFVTGVLLSDIKCNTRINTVLKKYSLLFGGVLAIIGALFFIIKQIPIIYTTDINHLRFAIQFAYVFPWACTIIFLTYFFKRMLNYKFFTIVGTISYELYLVHGYLLAYMDSLIEIPIVVGIMAVSAYALYRVDRMLSKIL